MGSARTLLLIEGLRRSTEVEKEQMHACLSLLLGSLVDQLNAPASDVTHANMAI